MGAVTPGEPSVPYMPSALALIVKQSNTKSLRNLESEPRFAGDLSRQPSLHSLSPGRAAACRA